MVQLQEHKAAGGETGGLGRGHGQYRPPAHKEAGLSLSRGSNQPRGRGHVDLQPSLRRATQAPCPHGDCSAAPAPEGKAHLGLIPGTFSVLEAPALLLKASLSTLLPLRDGAESEMVYPLGRRPLGERGQPEGKGPSGCAGPRPWLSSPEADQEAPAPSRIPDCDRALASGLSRPTSVLSPGSPSMSCRVCSSGEELDLLRGWEGWKESSTEGRAPSEETARSMGIPPVASSSAGYFSSWLELEDDCQEGGHRTSVRRDQRAHPGVHLEAMKPPPSPSQGHRVPQQQAHSSTLSPQTASASAPR